MAVAIAEVAEAEAVADAAEAEAVDGLPELLLSPSLAGLYVIVGRGAPASGSGDRSLEDGAGGADSMVGLGGDGEGAAPLPRLLGDSSVGGGQREDARGAARKRGAVWHEGPRRMHQRMHEQQHDQQQPTGVVVVT